MSALPSHLAHLPVWQGLPVPYVNRRAVGERSEDWGIRYDRVLREIAAHCADEPGAPPDFRHQCIQRQRECILLGLCQVCKRTVPWPDRQVVVSSVSVEHVKVAGRGSVPVVTEPWLCPDCAGFATTVCPELIRRRHDEDLHVVAMPSPAACRLVVSRGWITGRYEAVTKANPVAMWAKIQLLNVEVKTDVSSR